MKKNRLFLLIAMLMSMACKNVFAYDAAVKNNDGVTIYYNYISEGKELEVTYEKCEKIGTDYLSWYNSSGYEKLTVINIPETVTTNGRNRKVTSIGDWAFSGCSGLTSVTIPNSVTRIDEGAFRNCTGLISVHISDLATWCKISFYNWASTPLYYAHHLFLNGQEIKELVIPNSVTTIGDYAFRGCYDLTSVTIPNSVTSIGNSAFEGCSGLTSVTIPNSVTSIGNSAFEGCSGLTSVTIPNSVTSIGRSLFHYCSGLTSVIIPNSVTCIGVHAFWGCSGLSSVTIPNSVTSIDAGAFYNCSGLSSVTIPNSVTSIGESAFWGCSGLTSVTIGNSVTSIGYGAFSGCSGLTTIDIPNSVTNIGSRAFEGCSSLTSVHILDLAAWCKIDFDVVYSNPLENAHHLFLCGQEIKALVIPNTVTIIGSGVFSGCTGLTSVTIPNSVTTIGRNAFYGCSGLTSVFIPNSVTSIDWEAFYGCSGLSSVTIPNSVTNVGYGAFNFTNSNNDVLVKIISLIENPTAQTGYNFSTAIYNNATLYVPVGTMAKYKQTDGWKKFVWIEEGIPTGIALVKQEKIAEEECRYDLNGNRVKGLRRGVNIVKTSDGKTRKVVVK